MEHHQHEQKYTCPMHPDIVQDKPGNCPICGMTLVLAKESESKADDSPPQHGKDGDLK